jgi:DNA-binding NarL/FixJ family response regulator
MYTTSFPTQQSPAPIRVAVIDDHPIMRSGICTILSRRDDIQLVGEGGNGDSALKIAQTTSTDVVILDVSMPGQRPVDIVRDLTALPQSPRVVILTAYADVDTILLMLRGGSAAYVLKDEDASILIDAVLSVARGKTYMSPAVSAALLEHTLKDQYTPANPFLSAREIDILNQLARGKDNREIGELLHISERTVRFHLGNIYDKLHMRRGEVIAWSIRRGLGQCDEQLVDS